MKFILRTSSEVNCLEKKGGPISGASVVLPLDVVQLRRCVLWNAVLSGRAVMWNWTRL